MGFLDGGIFGLGGGSNNPTINTQTTQTSPWAAAQPHLKNIFAGAEEAYGSDAPSYFSGSTVVGFSPQTEAALGGIEQRALAGSDLQRAGMNQAQSTINGDYLNANPFLTGAYNAASAPVMEQWNNQIAPGIDSSFAGAGRMGSGLYAQNRNTAENTLGRSLTDMSSKMAYANYAQERQNQLDMTGQAGQMAQQDYGDLNKLMAVGGAREGLSQAQLGDEINRFNFEQNRPWDQLARYSGMIGGGYGTQQETGTPMYSNPGANFLSGALGGATIGNMMGYPGLGAIGGGLLGLMG